MDSDQIQAYAVIGVFVASWLVALVRLWRLQGMTGVLKWVVHFVLCGAIIVGSTYYLFNESQSFLEIILVFFVWLIAAIGLGIAWPIILIALTKKKIKQEESDLIDQPEASE